MGKLLSIVMSVYNSEESLSKAIESILKQSINDFEFILIDDGSTDESFAIMRAYSEKDNRIKIIRNKTNLGLTKSLNKAISLSKGEFIARQDADDFSLPNRLKYQLNFLKKHPNYAFCGTNGYWIQNMKEMIKLFTFSEILKDLIADNCFLHSSVMIRTYIFQKFGKYNEKYTYSQDYELWSRLIYRNRLKAANLTEKLIMRSKPQYRFLRRNKKKFLIQKYNCIKIKFRNLRYARCKIKAILSIFINILEIITFLSLVEVSSSLLKKVNL